MEKKLWYTTPTDQWYCGLPIGNGRIAAMAVNREDADCIQLNHEWLWRGVYRERENEYAADKLGEVREKLLSGDFLEGTRLANAYFGGNGGVSGRPNRVDPYQTAGELCFQHSDKSFVRRELDLDTGVVSVRRRCGMRTYAHCQEQFLVCEWEAGESPVSGRLAYSRVADPGAATEVDYTEEGFTFDCSFDGGIQYKVCARYFTDGVVGVSKEGITIDNAGYVRLFLTIATSVKGIEEELALYPLPQTCPDMERLFAAHSRKFFALMNRMKVELETPTVDLPVNERIERMRAGKEDGGLMLLYFNYGKYLLVSSSVCGELPANLQGKWNDSINPPWESDYHFDINLEMNYWAAEAVNMPECVEALLQYVERFVPHARKAAKDLYGCRGVFLPIQTDAWGRSTPESYGWAVWIGAAPWIAQNFWRHYLYSGDKGFLRERAYPFFQQVAAFYEDYLVRDKEGIYQIVPSQSPENRFEGTGEFPVSIGISSAMDVQLCYDALDYAIKSAEILQADGEMVAKWKEIQEHLPEFAVGADGRLLEWDVERAEAEPGHRHLSHLYGLYPSDLFAENIRPKQYQAAVRSLEERLRHGGGHTGWSRAWVACLYARIGDKERFWEHFTALVKDFASETLLDFHPPRIFQIDGNLGAVAAAVEALFSYRGGELKLLSALPDAWKAGGRVQGARIPGGKILDFAWKDGEITELRECEA